MAMIVANTCRTCVAVWMASALLMIGTNMALAEKRIALVVGNGEYERIVTLENPTADATLIAESLEDVGFEVTLLIDADQDAMKRGIAQFGRSLREAGPDATGLFYYAGHGIEAQGSNYLLPVDGDIRDAADLDLVAVEADWVLRQLFSARNRTNIVILDACRNNPFGSMGGSSGGLAEMKAPTGTFISYASAPGSVALDGEGSNSPFTLALSQGVLAEGAPIEQVFKQVRIDVLEQTGGLQTPWDSSSLTGDFFFRPAEPMSAEEVAAQQLWNSVRTTDDPVQLMLFLRAYPSSAYADEARAALTAAIEAELKPEEPAAEPEPSQAAAPAPSRAPAGPSERETALIERAQTTGALEDYEAYSKEFPAGVFASLAEAEIANLRAKSATAAAAPAPAPEPVPEMETEVAPGVEIATMESPVGAEGPITFLSPLTRGAKNLEGRTIAQIIEGSPLFPPVEGLPDEYWKDAKCSNCHDWTKEALCDQGQTYLSLKGQSALGKEHPLGGSFKATLREWAGGGCQ